MARQVEWMRQHDWQLTGSLLAVAVGLFGATTVSAQESSSANAKLALSLKPTQKDVEYEQVTAEQLPQCKLEVERKGKLAGWVVYGPAGQVLRKFYDTNGDNEVDQWRYYNHGLEVYRDIDSNFNKKVDQSRWVNLGGTRWGVDPNEDGRIDSWKILSAAEASKEAVRAMTTGDDATLQLLMFSESDAKALGLNAGLAKKLLEQTADAGRKGRTLLSKSKVLTTQSKWVRFDAQAPCLIPGDDGKANDDLQVYESAMCIVDNGGQTGLVHIGEMIRVGDVWKLTQVPQPVDKGETIASGLLMTPDLSTTSAATPTGSQPSPEIQKLLAALQDLDKKAPAPTATGEAMTKYHAQRAELLQKLVLLSDTEDEKNQWLQQMVDGIAASAQAGTYPEGLAKLRSMEVDLRKTSPKSQLVAYVTYRRLLAEYSTEMQKAPAEKRADLQKEWLKGLESFITAYPNGEDVPDAMLQLAITEEFNGRSKEAVEWYQRLSKEKGTTVAGKRATGAIRRLDLKGKPLSFAGPGLTEKSTVTLGSYKGSVVLVMFWATWCQPCTEDLPQIRALYQQYKSKGFEIVGVCLDVTKEDVAPFLQAQKVTWPQIYAPGGLESGPATEFGIISLPTMFVLDRDGKVASRNATTQDLKTLLPELLQPGGK